MHGPPPETHEPPGPPRRPLSAGAIVALCILPVFAVIFFVLLGFTALLMSDPPECAGFIVGPDVDPQARQAQCEQARQEWNMLPAALVGVLAVLPLLAVAAALVWRRSPAARWIALAAIVGSPALAFLVATLQA